MTISEEAWFLDQHSYLAVINLKYTFRLSYRQAFAQEVFCRYVNQFSKRQIFAMYHRPLADTFANPS
jgi:hypothetical protein